MEKYSKSFSASQNKTPIQQYFSIKQYFLVKNTQADRVEIVYPWVITFILKAV